MPLLEVQAFASSMIVSMRQVATHSIAAADRMHLR
jgi:hypothetical protein